MRRAIACLLLLVSASAPAAEILVTLADGKLGARVTAIPYPATLPKELASGLTNRLYARVSLLDAGQVIGQHAIEIALRYDLWDERFTLVSTTDDVAENARSLAKPEVDALLNALMLPKLFDAATLRGRDLVLRVELLLNPIDREKMLAIRKWVARNSAARVAGDPGISNSNSIFNRIFEQYSDGSDVAAVWRVEAMSAPFRVESLGDGAR